MSNCHRRLAKTYEKKPEGTSVQLLSTISKAPVMDTATEPVVKQKKPTSDPRFEQQCSPAQLFDLTPPSNKSVYYRTQECCSP